MTQLPVRVDEGDRLTFYFGSDEYIYAVTNIEENIVTVYDESTDRGEIDLDEYEICDMFNGAERFSVKRAKHL